MIHLGVFAFDDRPRAGPLSWRKPATFGLSFGLTLATVVWVTSYVVTARTRAVLLAVFAIDCGRSRRDHVAGLAKPALAPRHREAVRRGGRHDRRRWRWSARLGPGRVRGHGAARPSDGHRQHAAGCAEGLLLLVFGLLSGAAVKARGTVEKRTGTAARAYEVTGFMQDFHGVTLHGVLVLPALAWCLARTSLTEATRYRLVAAAIGCYVAAAVTVLAFDLLRG